MEYRKITWRVFDEDMKPPRTEVQVLPVHRPPAEVRRAKPASTSLIIKRHAGDIRDWVPPDPSLTAEEERQLAAILAKRQFKRECQARWLQMIQLGF